VGGEQYIGDPNTIILHYTRYIYYVTYSVLHTVEQMHASLIDSQLDP